MTGGFCTYSVPVRAEPRAVFAGLSLAECKRLGDLGGMPLPPGASFQVNPAGFVPATLAVLVVLGLVVAGLGLSGCAIATPLRHGADGPADALPSSTVLVAVTEAVLDPRQRRSFDRQTTLLYERLPAQPGCVAYSRRKQLFGHKAWTLTVWRDPAAYAAFVGSAEHRTAMRDGVGALRSAKFLKFEWPSAGPLPTWSEALERLGAVESRPYGTGAASAPLPAGQEAGAPR
jgi:quinol monooxygenase YgiN